MYVDKVRSVSREVSGMRGKGVSEEAGALDLSILLPKVQAELCGVCRARVCSF